MPTETMQKKQFFVANFEIKAKDETARTFEGYLNTWQLDVGNGYYRDKVWPGAFAQWIAEFKGAQSPYAPLIDGHGYESIMNVYGHLLEPKEDVKGLFTKWQVIDGPDGDRVFARLRPGSVRKMSMGYEAVKFDFEELEDGTQQRNIRECRVIEGSLVVFGMNDSSEVTRVKRQNDVRKRVERMLTRGACSLEVGEPRRIAMTEQYRRIVLRRLGV